MTLALKARVGQRGGLNSRFTTPGFLTLKVDVQRVDRILREKGTGLTRLGSDKNRMCFFV